MKKYNHNKIDKKWQNYWRKHQIYNSSIDNSKIKFYGLEMFPYPSGVGLHVGHPLGYVASDIYVRYKRMQGYNVLHPMGFDTFGLPAEQYAIQTGQHPAMTTAKNVKKYRKQLNMLGLSYDWDREIITSDPKYYKWTQWIFIKLFHSWYDKKANKAKPIEELKFIFSKEGNYNIHAECDEQTDKISNNQWNSMHEDEKYKFLLKYRLAYLANTTVNWCPELNTVLANEEVIDGVSERGGYPVYKKKMKQWMLRIRSYADRLLSDLSKLDWSNSIKEVQKNWIGKSEGCEIDFIVNDIQEEKIRIFTTRPETIFGATYLAIAPEHSILEKISLTKDVIKFIESAKNLSKITRSKSLDNLNGIFTNLYAVHPFTKEKIPVWIADYILPEYGRGAVMGVPAHDERDYKFAKKNKLTIKPIFATSNTGENTFIYDENNIVNSQFLNGLTSKKAKIDIIKKVEKEGIGNVKINYKIHDTICSRQRYWGEPIPIYYKNGLPYTLEEDELPLELPTIEDYKPSKNGDPPLGKIKDWKTKDGYPLEINTMPGWAGSSWYFIRYMDNKNDNEFVNNQKQKYWNVVDLYVGGSEHATGHLIYSRFWTKFLYDLKLISFDEPFKKMVNQGMIQGISKFVYRIKGKNKFVSYNLRDNYETNKLHVDVSLVKNNILNIDKFKKWREEYKDSTFILEGNQYLCGSEVEKMSKSKYNTVSPDKIIEEFGADSFRLYSMFLGPISASKPWSNDGIDGTYRFLNKVWRLFHLNQGDFFISNENPTSEELKILHEMIKKVSEDIEKLSLNTCVSSFMICVNKLYSLKCNKRDILCKLLLCLSPFAPHITEELWNLLGNKFSISKEKFPIYERKFLEETHYLYPVSINGKTKVKLNLKKNISQEEVEKVILHDKDLQKFLQGNKPKKIIFVHKKIINIVL